MTLETLLLCILGAAVLVVATAGALPVLIVVEGEYGEERRAGHLTIGFLLGLLGIRASFGRNEVGLSLLFLRRPTISIRRARTTVAAPGREPVQGEGRPVRTGMQAPGGEVGPGPAPLVERLGAYREHLSLFGRPGVRLLGTLRRAFRLRVASCDVVFGTGDPATTGQLLGLAHALRFASPPRVRIEFEPDFLSRTLEVRGSVALWMSLLRVLYGLTRATATVVAALGWRRVKRRWAMGLGGAKGCKIQEARRT